MLKRLPHALFVSLAFAALAAHAEPPESPAETSAAPRSNTAAPSAKTETTATVGPENNETATAPAQTTPPAAISKPDGWQLFTPPAGDFHILLPANVQRKVDDQPGKTSIQYFQHADEIDYLVTDGKYISSAQRRNAVQGFFEEAVGKIEQQLNKKNQSLVTRELSEVSGKGWHGKQVSFKTNDKDLATIRIVFSSADDVGYKLLASSGLDNPRVRMFFDSFEVDPAVASKAHLGMTSSSTVRNFVGVVWPLSLLVLGAVVVSLVVAAFKNRKD